MKKYSKHQLEQQLDSAVNSLLPDIGPQLSEAHGDASLECLIPAVQRPRCGNLVRILATCICVVLLCSTGVLGYFYPTARIGIDVNPSIALETNVFDRVISAEAQNQEAELVLEGLKLRYVDLDTAISAIIGSMVQQAYFADGTGAVWISVVSDSDERVVRLEEKITQDVRAALPSEQSQIPIYTQSNQGSGQGNTETVPPETAKPVPSVQPEQPTDAPAVTPTTGQIAEQPEKPAVKPSTPKPPSDGQGQQEPNGKRELIAYLLRLDPTLDADALQTMSVKDLRELAEELEDRLEREDEDDQPQEDDGDDHEDDTSEREEDADQPQEDDGDDHEDGTPEREEEADQPQEDDGDDHEDDTLEREEDADEPQEDDREEYEPTVT